MMDCKVYHAGGDADCLIVKQAIESALTKETILVGEDTDVLILLIYFADLKGDKIYLKSETKQYSKRKMTLFGHTTNQEIFRVISLYEYFIYK